MFYSFYIRFNEQALNREVEAKIIMKLPQNQLQEVKRNPFVIDLLNHPFIKKAINRVSNYCPVLMDNIQKGPSIMPQSVQEIVCKYKKYSEIDNYYTFCFKIYAEMPAGYGWYQPLFEFVCNSDYDAYERLYFSNKYVVAPYIPNTGASVSNGYYFRLSFIKTEDLIRITDAKDPQRLSVEAIDDKGSISPMTLTYLHKSQWSSIRMNDRILSLIGFKCQYGNIYGLTGVCYYEGVLSSNGNAKIQIFLCRDTYGYSLLIEDKKATNSCIMRKFFYLDELQELLRTIYHAEISLNNQELAKICRYFRDVKLASRIIAELPQVVDDYSTQNVSQQFSAQNKASYVAKYFGITIQEAIHYLQMMYLLQ